MKQEPAPGIVAQWKAEIERWAIGAVNNPDAVRCVRGFPCGKSPTVLHSGELAPMWFALAIALGLQTRMLETPSARKLNRIALR